MIPSAEGTRRRHGLGPFSTRAWLAAALGLSEPACGAWARGRLIEVINGDLFDIVEVDFATGRRARIYMTTGERDMGPHIASAAYDAVWIPVPIGTAYRLVGVPGAAVPGAGWKMPVPPPDLYLADRAWILPPDALTGALPPEGALTRAEDLREALEAAASNWASPLRGSVRAR
ncbi:hypothetical protein CTZ27_33465 [Streptomyces griseocarneus]|nr:hypothetical protein CTZ27_33465 [Streptomyces griseocarneus]